MSDLDECHAKQQAGLKTEIRKEIGMLQKKMLMDTVNFCADHITNSTMSVNIDVGSILATARGGTLPSIVHGRSVLLTQQQSSTPLAFESFTLSKVDSQIILCISFYKHLSEFVAIYATNDCIYTRLTI